MRYLEAFVFGSAVVLTGSLFVTTARACNFYAGNVGNGYCNGCEYGAGISVARNEACEANVLGFSGNASQTLVEYLGSKIVVPAKHGMSGASGNMVAYKANKDYVGTDEFVKETTYRQAGVVGHYRVRYTVTVK